MKLVPSKLHSSTSKPCPSGLLFSRKFPNLTNTLKFGTKDTICIFLNKILRKTKLNTHRRNPPAYLSIYNLFTTCKLCNHSSRIQSLAPYSKLRNKLQHHLGSPTSRLQTSARMQVSFNSSCQMILSLSTAKRNQLLGTQY